MHSLPNAKIKIASDRFEQLSEAKIKTFSEDHENVNTKKTTLYDSKNYSSYLQVRTKGENFKKFLRPNYKSLSSLFVYVIF